MPEFGRAICGALILLLATTASAEIYRWVDEDGTVHFSDRVPPPVSKRERHVLDEKGNLRSVLHRQRTAEELAQHRERLEAMKSESERRRQQDKYDQFLLTTFSNVDELKFLRDDRLALIDQDMDRAQGEIEDIHLELAQSETGRVQNPIAEQTRIRALEDRLNELKGTQEQLRTKRVKTVSAFWKDIQRYEYLRLKNAIP